MARSGGGIGWNEDSGHTSTVEAQVQAACSWLQSKGREGEASPADRLLLGPDIAF